VYLASSPEVHAVTGLYFAAGRPRRSSPSSYDQQVATKLWRISADLVGLDEPSP
jgi:hypothetical protein